MELIFLYSFLLIFVMYSPFGNPTIIPRMSPFSTPEITLRDQPSPGTENIQTFIYQQTLDHYNFFPQSSQTFNQRYMVNLKYWGGAKSSAPILVYLGAETALDGMPATLGFMTDNAASFKSMLVYIEHRFYGESVPFASNAELIWDANNLGSFTSAQAIVDYAMVIMHIKEAYQAQLSPVIVIGGSYGGMLATWFRLKFPHLAIGALASSAPLLYFDTPQDAYYDVVTRDFKEASKTCYETILNSWAEIDRLASEPNGFTILSQKFNTCSPLIASKELVDYLRLMYVHAAQYDFPPHYPVTTICNGIDGGAFGIDTLSRIYGGLVAYKGLGTCKINALKSTPNPFGALGKIGTFDGWTWQTCTELVIPFGIGNRSMFPPKPYDSKEHEKSCKHEFGVSPSPHWVPTFYGGLNISLALQNFGSNIIFSNGLKDPYSSSGILNSLSDTLVALHTTNGVHCHDLLHTTPGDPKWLIHQRKKEVKIIHEWLNQYYGELNITNESGAKRSSYCLLFVVLLLSHFGLKFLF